MYIAGSNSDFSSSLCSGGRNVVIEDECPNAIRLGHVGTLQFSRLDHNAQLGAAELAKILATPFT
jgi:hypothetical protein